MSTQRNGRSDRIMLKHGAGGRAMRTLISEVFARGFAEAPLDGIGLGAMDDGAALRIGDRWLVVTTDSHVIQPIFFPGGDIGRLAVAGTTNDLAMMGATEVLALTCSVVIEEGFPRSDLERIQSSIRRTCEEARSVIVTGDTKVMGKGELDGIILNTTGVALTDRVVVDSGLNPGDLIVLTGSVGDHGMAVMAIRHKLEVEGGIRSDVQPINDLIRCALDAADGAVTAIKDPTRGGVAGVLNEMAAKSGVGIILDETRVPVSAAVRSISELIGIDPLLVANEGKAVLGVRPEAADRVVGALRSHPKGRQAAVVGRCVADHTGMVVLDTGVGRRLLTEPEGELLPRIC